MNVLMISRSVFSTDVRIRREAEALAGAGHQVSVVGLGSSESAPSGVEVIGLGGLTGLKGRRRVGENRLHRVIRWLLLPNHRRLSNREFAAGVRRAVEEHGLQPDVVHAHDFPALEASAFLVKERPTRMVYDSHEYWRGMTRHGRPDPFARALDRHREEELAQSADAIITISDGAASLLARELKVEPVTVVRNTFPLRDDLAPPETPKGAVYAGRIAPGRDLDTVFASSTWSNLELHLIGSIENSIEPPPSALVHPSASLGQVDELLVGMGLALVPLTRGPLNHDVALPNKLFQAVSVGIPVVAANLPEMGRLVEQNELGITYEPGDVESFADAVRDVVDRYQELRASVVKARPRFDWSTDARALTSLYDSLA